MILKNKIDLEENYCYYCESSEYDCDEDGHEDVWCKKNRRHFNGDGEKVKCSSFSPIIETCQQCLAKKPITEFYGDGYPMVCSKECSDNFANDLAEQERIDKEQAEYFKQLLEKENMAD